MIEAILIDYREPKWVQELSFGGVPVAVTELEAGDVNAVTDDGCNLVIERKTADDLLNTLREDRLFPQMVRLSEGRLDQHLFDQQLLTWPYLMITGMLQPDSNGKILTQRGQTGWSWSAIQGALLSIQEMGVFVVQVEDDKGFEKAILHLGERKRKGLQRILPPRPGQLLGPGFALLASLPGVGLERATELMTWAGNIPAHAICGITDLEIKAPLGEITRKKIRQALGLKDKQTIELTLNNFDDEVLKVMEQA